MRTERVPESAAPPEIEPAVAALPNTAPLASDPSAEVPDGRHAAADAATPPPAIDPMATRLALLRDFRQARDRPVAVDHALAAVKLRGAAVAQYDKNEFSRLRPALLKRHAVSKPSFQELLSMPPDDAIAWLADHPGEGSRTLLCDLAEAHLLMSFGIDHGAFRRGIRKAALLEQMHSVAGRVVSLAGTGISFGTSFVAPHGASHVVKRLKKAARFLGHQLPNNFINPALTGWLRSKTDVIETYRRVGGAPVVASTIERSSHMGEVRGDILRSTAVLRLATARLRRAEDWRAELPAFVEAWLQADAAADAEYKSRMAFNKLSSYSKAWGGAVNLVASVGTLASIAGQPHVGLAFAAAAVPLQWLAGVGDEHTKHDYNHRANTKWALHEVLVDEARHLPFEQLRPEHISPTRLRALFSQLPQMQVAGVREVYEDQLGEWLKKATQLESRIARKAAAGAPAAEVRALQASLARREERIEALKQDVVRFESMDETEWRAIAPASLIGRCLDDLGALSRRQRRARTNRPGELSAQVLQRYAQAFHSAPAAAGVLLPIAEGLAIGSEGAGAAEAIGTVGASGFIAATGEVRADKARNKPVLARRMVDPARWHADAARWTFEAGGRRIDLRNTGGYNQLVHTRLQRAGRVAAEVPRSLFTGPVGLVRLVGARKARREAKAMLAAALEALLERGAQPVPGLEGRRTGRSIAALRHRFVCLQPVYDLISGAIRAEAADTNAGASSSGAETSGAREPGADATIRLEAEADQADPATRRAMLRPLTHAIEAAQAQSFEIDATLPDLQAHAEQERLVADLLARPLPEAARAAPAAEAPPGDFPRRLACNSEASSAQVDVGFGATQAAIARAEAAFDAMPQAGTGRSETDTAMQALQAASEAERAMQATCLEAERLRAQVVRDAAELAGLYAATETAQAAHSAAVERHAERAAALAAALDAANRGVVDAAATDGAPGPGWPRVSADVRTAAARAGVEAVAAARRELETATVGLDEARTRLDDLAAQSRDGRQALEQAWVTVTTADRRAAEARLLLPDLMARVHARAEEVAQSVLDAPAASLWGPEPPQQHSAESSAQAARAAEDEAPGTWASPETSERPQSPESPDRPASSPPAGAAQRAVKAAVLRHAELERALELAIETAQGSDPQGHILTGANRLSEPRGWPLANTAARRLASIASSPKVVAARAALEAAAMEVARVRARLDADPTTSAEASGRGDPAEVTRPGEASAAAGAGAGTARVLRPRLLNAVAQAHDQMRRIQDRLVDVVDPAEDRQALRALVARPLPPSVPPQPPDRAAAPGNFARALGDDLEGASAQVRVAAKAVDEAVRRAAAAADRVAPSAATGAAVDAACAALRHAGYAALALAELAAASQALRRQVLRAAEPELQRLHGQVEAAELERAQAFARLNEMRLEVDRVVADRRLRESSVKGRIVGLLKRPRETAEARLQAAVDGSRVVIAARARLERAVADHAAAVQRLNDAGRELHDARGAVDAASQKVEQADQQVQRGRATIPTIVGRAEQAAAGLLETLGQAAR